MPATNESLPQNERRSFFRATLVDRNWVGCLSAKGLELVFWDGDGNTGVFD